MEKFAAGVLVLGIVVTLIAGFSALFGFIFMLSWNFVVPAVFHGPQLTFLQAWAAMFVLNIIGSAFRNSGGSSS